jgi:hypothetical protein
VTGLRRDATVGSVDSIVEDLKFIRGRGGLVLATPSDLIGTITALLVAEPALTRLDQNHLAEHARQRLRAATIHVLAPLMDSTHSEGLRVGAQTVRKNLLEEPPDTRTLATKRREIADANHRSLDYVRQNEDVVLRLIAEHEGRELALDIDPPAAETLDAEVQLDAATDVKPERRGVQAKHGEKQLHLVTGTSGTGVNRILRSFASTRPYAVVQVERHFVDVAYPRLFDGENVTQGRRRVALMKVLGEPEPIVREFWQEAWTRAVEEARKALDHTDVLFTMHASYNHIGSQGLTTFIDLELIRDLEPRPVQIIQLADDIFDTLARLTTSQLPLFHAAYRRGDPLTNMLLRIAEWRQLETIISSAIAGLIGAAAGKDDKVIPFSLFAIKHPVETFERLITNPHARRVYLSHPIAYPRETTDSDRPFRELWTGVEAVASGLRADPETVLFEPTTIDELRFHLDQKQHVASIRLQDRWTSLEHLKSRLWNWSQPVESDFAEQPFAFAIADGSREDHVINETRGEPLAGLDVLREYLRQQVASRDRQLVSQSNDVVALRPFGRPDGAHAGGVSRELSDHNDILMFERSQGDTERRPAIVYHPRNDENRRRRSTVLRVLAGMSQPGERQLIYGWTEGAALEMSDRLTNDLLEIWTTQDSPERVADHLVRLLSEMSVKPYISQPRDQTAMGGDTEAAGVDEARRLVGEAISVGLKQRYGQHDPYARDWLDGLEAEVIDQDLDEAHVLARVLERLRSHTRSS